MERIRLARAATISDGASPISEIGAPRAIRPLRRASRIAIRASPARVAPSRRMRRTEIVAQPGPLQLAPADARQVARHQRQQNAAARQPLQQRFHARAMLVVQRRAHAQIVALGRAPASPASPARALPRNPGVPHHHRQDVGVEHALHGNAVGGGFEARHAADALHQRFAMMRARPAHQCAVDIEENQGAL